MIECGVLMGVNTYAIDEDCLINLTIPDEVLFIDNRAFKGCKNLKSVTIPDSVMSIGCEAFEGCKKLKSVTIPSSVTKIECGAFSNCGDLSINRPSLQISEEGAVYSIVDIKGDLNIPSSINGITVTLIESFAFSYCKDLTSVTIPNTVTNIWDCAFADCSSLTSVTIPNSVTNISESAFRGCKKIPKNNIPKSVTSIGKYDDINKDEICF